MSYKWPDKDPDELVDYSVDWSRFLDTDSIQSATWFIHDASDVKTEVSNSQTVNGLQFIIGTLPTATPNVATARFGLGTNNVKYKIVCRVDTDNGNRYERSIFLRIKEK